MEINPITEDLNKEENETQNDIEKHHPIILSNPQDFKTSALLREAKDSTTNRIFKRSLRQRQNAPWDLPLDQPYSQLTSLYLINKDNRNKTNLFIYDVETGSERVKVFNNSETFDNYTCITQFPNGNLFCFGDWKFSGIAAIIDGNYKFHMLPLGTPCIESSVIYFNRNVYCFGGRNKEGYFIPLSSRFDLIKNRWVKLTPMPWADDRCHSIIFNGNILFVGFENKNILQYSINLDSFSIIPYNFEQGKLKLLIRAERLYLIEAWNGHVYENDGGDQYNWKKIADSTFSHACQTYCLYNKGEIYIGILSDCNEYYKFILDEKVMVQL